MLTSQASRLFSWILYNCIDDISTHCKPIPISHTNAYYLEVVPFLNFRISSGPDTQLVFLLLLVYRGGGEGVFVVVVVEALEK